MRTSYLAGQELSRLLGWSEDERQTDARGIAALTTTALTAVFRAVTLLPHCILGGEPVNKAANSEPEQVAAAARRPAPEKE
jgi:hypothetical protein